MRCVVLRFASHVMFTLGTAILGANLLLAGGNAFAQSGCQFGCGQCVKSGNMCPNDNCNVACPGKPIGGGCPC